MRMQICVCGKVLSWRCSLGCTVEHDVWQPTSLVVGTKEAVKG